mgnify:CR=1 FL=1
MGVDVARIAYTRNAGIAENIRHVRADYVFLPSEFETTGEGLPSVQFLSDPAAWAAKERSTELESLRQDALEAIKRQRDEIALEAALNDPNAPQAVKDFKAAKEK